MSEQSAGFNIDESARTLRVSEAFLFRFIDEYPGLVPSMVAVASQQTMLLGERQAAIEHFFTTDPLSQPFESYQAARAISEEGNFVGPFDADLSLAQPLPGALLWCFWEGVEVTPADLERYAEQGWIPEPIRRRNEPLSLSERRALARLIQQQHGVDVTPDDVVERFGDLRWMLPPEDQEEPTYDGEEVSELVYPRTGYLPHRVRFIQELQARGYSDHEVTEVIRWEENLITGVADWATTPSVDTRGMTPDRAEVAVWQDRWISDLIELDMVNQFQAWALAGHAPENQATQKGVTRLGIGPYRFEGLYLSTHPITDWDSNEPSVRGAVRGGTTSLYWRELAREAFDAELPAPGPQRDRVLASMRRLASGAIERLREFTPEGASVFVDAQQLRGMLSARGAIAELHELLRSLPKVKGAPDARHPAKSGPRKSNRKITRPFAIGTMYIIPNIQNGGTRNLGLMIAGGVDWTDGPDGRGKIAKLAGATVGMMEIGPGEEAFAAAMIDTLKPHGIKTMIAASQLVYEKTNHQPLNRAATISVGEVARVFTKTGKDRKIDPVTLLRVAHELQALTKIQTYAADGPYDRRTHRAPNGWIAPLLNVTAIHVMQTAPDGKPFPYEFDMMLGRNWAERMLHPDFIQVASGFMKLGDEETSLAWFYLNVFRYHMTKRTAGVTRKIPTLCEEARLDPGLKKHRGRFLQRLEGWHQNLQRQGVIGPYERTPEPGANVPPSELFETGKYTVQPPAIILEAYRGPREKAQKRASKVHAVATITGPLTGWKVQG